MNETREEQRGVHNKVHEAGITPLVQVSLRRAGMSRKAERKFVVQWRIYQVFGLASWQSFKNPRHFSVIQLSLDATELTPGRLLDSFKLVAGHHKERPWD